MTFQYFLNRLLMGLFVTFIVEYHFKVVVYREFHLFITKEIILVIPSIVTDIYHG